MRERTRARTWADHEWAEVDGRRVHAAAMGRPGLPTVVLVHGQGSSHRYFRPLATQLAGRARVVAVDLPGFGLTPSVGPPLDLRELSVVLAGWLRATGRQGSVVVGHSVGCQVVVDTAVHSPEVLGRVVLAGATVDRGRRTWRSQMARLVANSLFERPDLGPVQVADYLRCGPRRYVATFSGMLADPIEDKVHLLRSPTLLLRGEWDLLSPRAWNELLAERLTDGRRAEIPRAGHTLGWTRPGPFAAMVEDVLAAADRDRGAPRPVGRHAVPSAIEPDTKDWTWVLGRPCPECGLDVAGVPRAEIAERLHANADAWPPVLERGDARERPDPATWSALEYGCHVRDVFDLFGERLTLMLTQDDPLFESWDQDETAVSSRYAEQDPAAVAVSTVASGHALAARFEGLDEAAWQRPGRRSDGAAFTVESFARYLLHDPVHHLHDVGGAAGGTGGIAP